MTPSESSPLVSAALLAARKYVEDSLKDRQALEGTPKWSQEQQDLDLIDEALRSVGAVLTPTDTDHTTGTPQ